MKKTCISVGILALALSLSACVPYSSVNSLRSQISSLQSEVNDLQAENSKLKNENAILEAENKELKANQRENSAEPDANPDNPDSGDVNEFGLTITPSSFPITFKYDGWMAYTLRIDEFTVTDYKESSKDMKLEFTVKGIVDDASYLPSFDLICYDASGYVVTTETVLLTDATSNEPFKLKQSAYIDKETVKIEIAKSK